jgi:hypothetical protein
MPFILDDWRQLHAEGKNIGTTGKGMQHLWEWTLTYRIPASPHEPGCSPGLQQGCAQATMVKKTKSRIAQSVNGDRKVDPPT